LKPDIPVPRRILWCHAPGGTGGVSRRRMLRNGITLDPFFFDKILYLEA
jgi:hypothetical protein